MIKPDMRRINMSMPWNLFLLTLGGVISALGLKCIAIPHEFISSGLLGTGIFVYYVTDFLTPAIWYTIFNIPVFLIGWRMVSRRFFLYTAYGMAINTLAIQFIPWTFTIQDSILAAVATGSLCGIGSAMMLKSLGSDGGLSIIGIVLNQRYDIKVGAFTLAYTVVLFLVSMSFMNIDNVLYSMVVVYIQSTLIDYAARAVNQRKLVFIVSDHAYEIAHDIMHKLHRGCTFLPSIGAYTNMERRLILTVVNNYQLKRLEELVYKIDANAFLIIESTYNVLGQGFSRRREY